MVLRACCEGSYDWRGHKVPRRTRGARTFVPQVHPVCHFYIALPAAKIFFREETAHDLPQVWTERHQQRHHLHVLPCAIEPKCGDETTHAVHEAGGATAGSSGA